MANAEKKKKKGRLDGRREATIQLGRDEDGKYIRKHVYGKNKAELEENMRIAKNMRDYGLDLSADKPTVKKWADKWLSVYKADLGRSMREVYQGHINKWLKPLHNLPIDKVLPIQLRELIQKAAGELSQSSIDKLFNCIRGIFSSAKENGLFLIDPSENLKKPKGLRKTKREALTSEEKALMESVCKSLPENEGKLPMLMMYAGLRINEALALTWGDIKDGFINVNKTIVYEENANKPTIKNSPKTDAGFRKIPILAPLEPYLQRDANTLDAALVFGRLHSKMMKHDLWERIFTSYEIEHKQHWDKAREGVKNTVLKEVYNPPRRITSHMLRHTYVTMLYEAGIDVKTAQKWSGHATTSVLMDIYTHLSQEKEIEAVNRLRAFSQKENSSKKVRKYRLSNDLLAK